MGTFHSSDTAEWYSVINVYDVNNYYWKATWRIGDPISDRLYARSIDRMFIDQVSTDHYIFGTMDC